MGEMTQLVSNNAESARASAVRRASAPRRQVDYPALRIRLYGLLLASDALFIAIAFMIADVLRYGSANNYAGKSFLILFPIYVAVGLNGGSAWSIPALSSARASAGAASRALLFACGIATLVFFTLKIGEDFSRPVFAVGSLLSLVLLAFSRIALGKRIGDHCGWTFRRDLLLIDGIAVDSPGSQIVVDAQASGLRPTTDDPLMLDRLARVLDGCERVVIAAPPERRRAWSRMLAGSNADVEVLAPELASVGALGLRRDGDRTMLVVGVRPLPLRDRAIKRAFDMLVSVTLLVILLPLLAVIALAVRLDSPGPVIFSQDRMGRGNRLFRMFKFRSMRIDAADRAGDRSASRDDDRVTRVGGFLRKTSLDELPQLLNVLKGDMSIVGPRPHPLGCRAEDELFWAIEDRYFDRHAIKPGITGLAQVRGFRGATWKRSDLTHRLQADLEYLAGWHIGRDIAIVLRTISVVVHPNAF